MKQTCLFVGGVKDGFNLEVDHVEMATFFDIPVLDSSGFRRQRYSREVFVDENGVQKYVYVCCDDKEEHMAMFAVVTEN